MHLGKVTILHISLRSIAEYLAKNSLRSFGKNFCKQFASLIWQKESLYRANFATFASLNICKIILNVRSAHYLQINLCTLAMLTHKLGPSLGFFGCRTLFYFGLLWQVGCRYTYNMKLCTKSRKFIERSSALLIRPQNVKVKIMSKIVDIFVAFSEKLNFTIKSFSTLTKLFISTF